MGGPRQRNGRNRSRFAAHRMTVSVLKWFFENDLSDGILRVIGGIAAAMQKARARASESDERPAADSSAGASPPSSRKFLSPKKNPVINGMFPAYLPWSKPPSRFHLITMKQFMKFIGWYNCCDSHTRNRYRRRFCINNSDLLSI